MGKKYKSVALVAPYNQEIEPTFEVMAYEGMKPSRAAAVLRWRVALRVVEADDKAEWPTNHKMKTDKPGRRPRVEVNVSWDDEI